MPCLLQNDMKERIKTVYYCDFCKKKGLVRPIIAAHETYCLRNPLNAAKCVEQCRHLTQTQFDVSPPEENYRTALKWFYCDALDTFLHSSVLLGKNLNKQGWKVEDYERALSKSKLMPKECGEFQL